MDPKGCRFFNRGTGDSRQECGTKEHFEVTGNDYN